MEQNELIAQIESAEMVLVGLGEDFDNYAFLKADEKYRNGYERLQEMEMHWLLPMWTFYCTQKNGTSIVAEALLKLQELLKDKNYFVVSVSTNPEIMDVPWKNNRIVMPCGTSNLKQCTGECNCMMSLDIQDEKNLNQYFAALYEGGEVELMSPFLGTCSECGKPMVLNNIFVEQYNENGYLTQWSTYMKWLQGTVNRKLLILELGVGLKFPSVVRWPFEKVAFFNQKSFFLRVHEKLYQLTAELSGKGCGISQNAIEWLRRL